jgi:LysR family transcriptional regulator, regulator for metE and metH
MKVLQGSALELEDLRLVAAVCQHGTLSRAALTLHLSQSALSHRLSSLEHRLGMRLFDRLGRSMRPTATGVQLEQSANEILAAVLQAEEGVRSKSKTAKTVLKLATQCYTCYDWLPRVLQHYRQRFQDSDVRIVLDATPDPVRALLQGQIDVAIVDQFSRKDRRIQSRRIFSDEIVAVFPRTHPWAKRSVIMPQCFATERLIAHNCSLSHNVVLRRILRPAKITPAETYEVPLTEAILELVKSGFGVAALARWAVEKHLTGGSLRGLPIGRNGFTRHWSLAMLSSTGRLAHAKHLLDVFTDEFQRKGA